MFLTSLTRRILSSSARTTRAYAASPPVDHEIRRLLETEKQSQSDPAVLSELDTFLNAPAIPESESLSELDFDFAEGGPQHASILTPEKVASTSKELFGTQARTTLQTLPSGFNTRNLPLPGPLPAEFTEIEYAATVVHGRSIHRPFRHPRTHGLPAAQIQFRSHDILTMHLFVHFATHAAYSLGIPCSRMYSLPTQRQLWTVLRGPFAHKKAQENFERKVHRRGLKAYDADPAVVDLWFKYLRRHAMGGVGMRCVKWERMPMSVGQKMETKVEDSFRRHKQDIAGRIKRLGAQIVQREMPVTGAAEAATEAESVETK